MIPFHSNQQYSLSFYYVFRILLQGSPEGCHNLKFYPIDPGMYINTSQTTQPDL